MACHIHAHLNGHFKIANTQGNYKLEARLTETLYFVIAGTCLLILFYVCLMACLPTSPNCLRCEFSTLLFLSLDKMNHITVEC